MELSMPVLLFLAFVATILVWGLIGLRLNAEPLDTLFVAVVHSIMIMIGVWTYSHGYANQTALMAGFAGAWLGYCIAAIGYNS